MRGAQVPVLIASTGFVFAAITWLLTRSGSTSAAVGGVPVGAALAMWGGIWQQARVDEKTMLAAFDSVRRDLTMFLAATPVSRLDRFITHGELPKLIVGSPVEVAHLHDAVRYAAANQGLEKLYARLLAVDKSVRYLNTLWFTGPVLRTSAWGIAGADIVAFEDGHFEQIDAAHWRQFRILLQHIYKLEQAQLLLRECSEEAVTELRRVLLKYRMSLTDAAAPIQRPWPPLSADAEKMMQLLEMPFTVENADELGRFLSDHRQPSP